MSLRLHAAYSIEDAVDECEGAPRFWCDDQFAVLWDVVLCFITVGKASNESRLPNPSSVTWRPARTDYARSDEFTWLPRDVREVFDRSGPDIVQLRHHHMFVRPYGGDRFFYAGEAHLGGYGYEGPAGNGIGNPVADFSLKEKLPRDLWLQCGGYNGWHIELNHEEHLVSQGDVASIDELLGQLETLDYSQLCLTRYEEDSLTIYTNPDRAWLVFMRDPNDPGLCLYDSSLGTDDLEFRCGCGISLEYPASQTVPHSEAVRIAKHFFTVGEIPSDVVWSEMRGIIG